jgi:hypothetical protein
MRYCKESEILDTDFIYSLLGRPYKDPNRLLSVSGSGGYFIEDIELEDSTLAPIPDDAKANIQRYDKGLLIAFNKSNRLYGLAVFWEEINKIQLSQGPVHLQPKFPLPLWWLLRFGVAPEKAKHFGLFGEYKQEPLTLRITFGGHQISLFANGFSFDEKASYFRALSDKTVVIIQ